MDRDEFMEIVYETFTDEPDNVLANGIIEAADAYVEHEKAQPSREDATKGTTSDLISRMETVEHLRRMLEATVPNTDYDEGYVDGVEVGISTVSTMPTIQPQSTTGQLNDGAQSTAQSTDLIDRQDAIDALDCINGVGEVLRSLPPAQSEPHEGHWIKHESPDGGEQYECSRCGVLWEFNDGTPEDNEAYFCPKCGAKMKGVKHETD